MRSYMFTCNVWSFSTVITVDVIAGFGEEQSTVVCGCEPIEESRMDVKKGGAGSIIEWRYLECEPLIHN